MGLQETYVPGAQVENYVRPELFDVASAAIFKEVEARRYMRVQREQLTNVAALGAVGVFACLSYAITFGGFAGMSGMGTMLVALI